MSASQRRKGAGGEREFCAEVFKSIGVECSRNLGQARDGGDDVTIKKKNSANFRAEVKRRRRIAVEAWLKQVEAASKPGDTPFVAMRADGGEWIVMLRMADFLPLMAGEL